MYAACYYLQLITYVGYKSDDDNVSLDDEDKLEPGKTVYLT